MELPTEKFRHILNWKKKRKGFDFGKKFQKIWRIYTKTLEELHLMRESAQLVSKTLGMIAKEIKPDVTTLHLDKLAHDFIKDHGGYPAF